MYRNTSKPFLLALLLGAAGAASAQQPAPQARPAAQAPAQSPAQSPAPALTPAQQEALAKQNSELSQAALKAAQLVDAGKVGELWDGASVVAKRAVPRQAFIDQVGAARKQLGAVAGRGQPALTRVRYDAGAPVPEGLYINVSFPTRFAQTPQPVRELVSFRLDEDQVWRLSGYNLPSSR